MNTNSEPTPLPEHVPFDRNSNDPGERIRVIGTGEIGGKARGLVLLNQLLASEELRSICSECMSCVFACGKNAINHDMVGEERNLNIGAIILAPGYQTYQASLSQEYGLGRYPNVVTSMQ